MELRVLKYFLMVAREENITKAAKALHMTQPTLSRQLMQLEEELGVKLFQRSRHQIILTKEGFLLKRRAQEILALTEKTREEIIQQEELSGEIVIGCGETRNMSYLSEKIRGFREAHPLVCFQIYSANADDVKERLEKGIADMGLLMEPVDIGKYDFIRMPEKERWAVLMEEDNELANREFIRKEDLTQMPLLMPWRESVRHELAGWFGEDYDQLDIVCRYNMILNAANMVRHHVGSALTFDFDVHFDGLRFVPLAPSLETGAVLVWKKNQMSSGVVNRFIDFVRNA